MKGQNPECPCGSGAKYAACCRRFHRGEEPGSPGLLMRSRFSAYALGELPYLYRTLDPEHPDKAKPEAEFIADVRRSRAGIRYTRLRVLEEEPHEGKDRARVLFHAELYQSGKELSFAEASLFLRRAEGWRYHSGEARPMRSGDPGLASLRLS